MKTLPKLKPFRPLIRYPDLIELSIRFCYGALFGLALGLFGRSPFTFEHFVIMASICGLLAVLFGNQFWRAIGWVLGDRRR